MKKRSCICARIRSYTGGFLMRTISCHDPSRSHKAVAPYSASLSTPRMEYAAPRDSMPHACLSANTLTRAEERDSTPCARTDDRSTSAWQSASRNDEDFNGSTILPVATTSDCPIRAPTIAGSCHCTSRYAHIDDMPTATAAITTIAMMRATAACRRSAARCSTVLRPRTNPHMTTAAITDHRASFVDVSTSDHALGPTPWNSAPNSRWAVSMEHHSATAGGSSLQSLLPRSRHMPPSIATPSPSHASFPASSRRFPTPQAAGRHLRTCRSVVDSRVFSVRSPGRCH